MPFVRRFFTGDTAASPGRNAVDATNLQDGRSPGGSLIPYRVPQGTDGSTVDVGTIWYITASDARCDLHSGSFLRPLLQG